MLALGLAVGALACYPLSLLSLETEQGACYVRADQFALRWQHSVEKQLWYEHYRLQDGQLLLYQTWLQTFGAGTPVQGQVLTDAPKGFVGYAQAVKLPSLNWAVSRNMQGSLLVNQHTLLLYQSLPDYSQVQIRPAQASLARFLLGTSCYDTFNTR
ncbi:hypothetical protein A4G20_01020 [Pasteurellaceae bacterium RH1A]|nr:hypothetical protein A4G20_01020 [Pasteurellaceae bacterium RH1A]